MAEEILIRQVEESDIAALWEIVQGMADSQDAFGRSVAQKRLAGYAWVHDYGPHIRAGVSTARLNDLIVGPAWRKRGVGRHLFESVRRWSESRGVRWLQWQSSLGALEFYARLGLTGNPCPDPEHPFFEIDFAGWTKLLK